MFGVQHFFTPRWMLPAVRQRRVARAMVQPVRHVAARELLVKYVDFDKLAKSPIRLMVSAVDIETSELVIFDSYAEKLTPDHIVASGSLPPSF